MWTPKKASSRPSGGIWNLAREPIFSWKKLLESGKLCLISALLLLFFFSGTHTHGDTQNKTTAGRRQWSRALWFVGKCCGKLKVFISEGKSSGGLRKGIHEKFHLKLMRYNSMISPNYMKLQGNHLEALCERFVTSVKHSCCWWGWFTGLVETERTGSSEAGLAVKTTS